MKLSPLAICILCTTVAHGQNLPPQQVLLRHRQLIQTPNGMQEASRPEMGSANRQGGHAWNIRLTGTPSKAIWGSRLGEPEGILRWPETIAGVSQVALFVGFQGLDEQGRITYGEDDDDWSIGVDGVRGIWIEDQLVVRKGDPVPAMPGWTFRRLGRPIGTFTDRLAFVARISNPSTGEDRAAAFLGHDRPPIVQEGDQIAGLPVDDFYLPQFVGWQNTSPLIFSPSGDHWLFYIRLGGLRALLLNGDLATFEGVPLLEGTATPPSLANLGVDPIEVPREQWVDDQGNWGAKVAYVHDTSGTQFFAVVEQDTIRESGSCSNSFFPCLHAIEVSPGNQARMASTSSYSTRDFATYYKFELDGYPSDLMNNWYDLDGDGLPDSIYLFGMDDAHRENVVVLDDGSIIYPRELSDDWKFGEGGRSLIRRPAYQLGATYCAPAQVNSTGSSARLVMAGSALAGGFALSARAFNLPANQATYFLAGTESAQIPMHSGSQGNLCLGGDLARFTSQLKVASADGIVEVDLDTLAFPFGQPAPVSPGSTLFFQAWFRDANPGPTSNFTDAVEITFD